MNQSPATTGQNVFFLSFRKRDLRLLFDFRVPFRPVRVVVGERRINLRETDMRIVRSKSFYISSCPLLNKKESDAAVSKRWLMAKLYGKEYTKAELLARVGDISQIARIKPYRLIEGREDGVMALDITNGGGLSFTVIPSRGMDISAAHYNGRSLAWRSSVGDAHPAYFDHEGENGRGWLRSFPGGLVTTCGLSWAGATDVEDGQRYGLHGRISNLPAENVRWHGNWHGDDYVLSVYGEVRQTTVFGENLILRREIFTRLGSSSFVINDFVENCGFNSTPHMMLYHINIGFPAVNDNARLISPSRKVMPRDADAEGKIDRYAMMQAPEVGYRETVYFHDLVPDKDEYVQAAVVDDSTFSGDPNNPGFGVYCRYAAEKLPRFIEWKMMGAGTYVVGMEPANCSVMGRPEERNTGALQYIEPGEERHYDLEIGVLNGAEEIAAFEAQCSAALANG